MDTQLQPLDYADAAARSYTANRTKAFRSWRLYHKKNPRVYERLVDILREMKAAGWRRWSIQGAIEVLRWKYRMEINGRFAFKIANEYGAYYARLIMMQEDDLYNFMRVTKSSADFELGWNAYKDARAPKRVN